MQNIIQINNVSISNNLLFLFVIYPSKIINQIIKINIYKLNLKYIDSFP